MNIYNGQYFLQQKIHRSVQYLTRHYWLKDSMSDTTIQVCNAAFLFYSVSLCRFNEKQSITLCRKWYSYPQNQYHCVQNPARSQYKLNTVLQLSQCSVSWKITRANLFYSYGIQLHVQDASVECQSDEFYRCKSVQEQITLPLVSSDSGNIHGEYELCYSLLLSCP